MSDSALLWICAIVALVLGVACFFAIARLSRRNTSVGLNIFIAALALAGLFFLLTTIVVSGCAAHPMQIGR